MLTLATVSATAALGSLYLIYQKSSVKADGGEGGVVAVKVGLIPIPHVSFQLHICLYL